MGFYRCSPFSPTYWKDLGLLSVTGCIIVSQQQVCLETSVFWGNIFPPQNQHRKSCRAQIRWFKLDVAPWGYDYWMRLLLLFTQPPLAPVVPHNPASTSNESRVYFDTINDIQRDQTATAQYWPDKAPSSLDDTPLLPAVGPTKSTGERAHNCQETQLKLCLAVRCHDGKWPDPRSPKWGGEVISKDEDVTLLYPPVREILSYPSIWYWYDDLCFIFCRELFSYAITPPIIWSKSVLKWFNATSLCKIQINMYNSWDVHADKA